MSEIPAILWEETEDGSLTPRDVAVPAGYSDSISPALAEVLNSGIKKASDENGSFEQHTVDDLIKAERYAVNKALTTNPMQVVKKGRLIAAGPVQ